MLASIHPLKTCLDDVGNLIAVCSVVANNCGVRVGDDGRVTVSVLKSLTGKGRSTGSGTNQESTNHLVSR